MPLRLVPAVGRTGRLSTSSEGSLTVTPEVGALARWCRFDAPTWLGRKNSRAAPLFDALWLSACSAATGRGLETLEPGRAAAQEPRADAGARCGADHRAAEELIAGGLDAGPVTFAWHIGREGLPMPSTSTIRRVLHAAGLVVPEPQKRPRSPGSDSRPIRPTSCGSPTSPTGGSPMDRGGVSRGSTTTPASCSADGLPAGQRGRRRGHFLAAGEPYGGPPPRSPTTAPVYTSRFTGGRNGFEYLLAYLGIRQQNGAPVIPRPRARSSASTRPSSVGSGRAPGRGPSRSCRPSSTPSGRVRQQRPHRAIGRVTPGEAYRARPKAHPAGRGARAPSACAPTSSTAAVG